MQWILIAEECEKATDKKAYFTEYEICSEVRIPGVFDYGDGIIQCGILQEANQDGLYTYTVRVKHIKKEYKFDEKNFSKEGYFFNDDLIGELITLFSFYFQARFYLKAIVFGTLSSKSLRTRDEKDFAYRRPQKLLNIEMFSDNNRNWAYGNGLKQFLDAIRLIDSKYHQSLIRAFYWYREAIKDIGVNHQLFYIKMVSSVEALLNFVELDSDSLESKMSDLIGNKKFNQQEIDELNNWLRNRKISQRFISFIKKYSKGFCKGGKRRASHCYIKKEDIEKYTKRIYKARSEYLHNGKPMYISFDMGMKEAGTWDLDPSLGMSADRRNIPANEKLPRPRWFERVVNYCLNNFIKEILQ